MRHVSLALAPAALTAALVASAAAQPKAAPSRPHVDAAVQVTATPAPSRAHATPSVAVHPGDGRVLAIGEGETRSGLCTVHVSTDAGLSWREGAAPQLPSHPRCSRSVQGPITDLAFGRDGTLYYAFAGWKLDDWRSEIFLGRSRDLGRSFETLRLPGLEPPYAPDDSGSNALPFVLLDPTRPNRVYLGWSKNYGLWNLEPALPEGTTQKDFPRRPMLAISEDGGRTFGKPLDLGGNVKADLTQPQMVVDGDGVLHAFFGEFQPFFQGPGTPPEVHLYHAVSRDGGTTWSQKVIHTRPGGQRFGFLLSPSPAIHPGTGDLLLAWEDTGRTPPGVLFMRSDDGGRTWTEPVKLNDADPQRQWDFQELNPWIDVAPGGRIDAAWMDWRDDAAFDPEARRNALQHVYATYSTDGGRTWAPNMRVTDRAIDRRFGVWSTGVHGPVALASLDSAAYVAWDDSRNGTPETHAQDVYFTRVRFPGAELSGSVPAAPTGMRLAWGVAGAGAALGLAGLALLAARVASAARRREGVAEQVRQV